eukprot:CCRYP_012042-RA/>CCRYP_012042-RA protein AED:0.44 eAED:0.44 QI:0/-1/0/1/-1/1/1/0/183
MPGYVKKALSQFQHPKPQTPQHAPFPATPINYGAHQQYAKAPSTATLLDPKGKKFIQQVCGKFLFLGRAVDPTLLCPISAIASQSSKPTVKTLKQTKQLLDYIGGALHHGPRGSLHPQYPGGTQTHTTGHPAPNRQLHRRRHRQRKDPTQTDQSHGHAIPLAPRSRMPGTVPHLLAPRQTQLR